jgi:deoxyribodipyrimidine photolyase-related protein
MKVLVLLSNHLNKEYIKNVEADEHVLLVAKEQFTYVKFHQFRIVYHLSASEHFALEHGISYQYVETFKDALKSYAKGTHIQVYNPNDVWFRNILEEACQEYGLNFTLLDDINFYFPAIEEELGRPPYKLDPLYRKWRTKFGLLMDGDKPLGGQFSYDQENRNRPPKELKVEKPKSFVQDDLTKGIVKDVADNFKDHPKSKQDFAYPVTRKEAEELLKHFIKHRLPFFGTYQDAMMDKEPFMVHSLISASINLGLLLAKDVVAMVEKAYHEQDLPIAAVEGFIRQILGWREYIRGIYLVQMDRGYSEKNYFGYERKSIDFLYQANTGLYCLDTSVKETMENAYNHHIQRLMIIGNLTTLLGVHPKSIRNWFLEMYVDSFDWVVTPNVFGMATYADGGLMSTKPYVSSANYINKMSNYCKKCPYNPKEKTGDHACPVNALYYYFLDSQKNKLKDNPRMKFMYGNFDRLEKETFQDMVNLAKTTIKKIGE